MTLRATATSAVGGVQDIPKIGVLKPFTRLTISANFISVADQLDGWTRSTGLECGTEPQEGRCLAVLEGDVVQRSAVANGVA
jgi:hypothetical protein